MKVFNETINHQLSHRTIREFKDQKIPDEILETLIEVARRTATSTGMQASSIIRVTDPDKKKQIAEVCNQEYVARMPELMIFIVDQYRNWNIAKEKNCFEDSIRTMDQFFCQLYRCLYYSSKCGQCSRIFRIRHSILRKHIK